MLVVPGHADEGLLGEVVVRAAVVEGHVHVTLGAGRRVRGVRGVRGVREVREVRGSERDGGGWKGGTIMNGGDEMEKKIKHNMLMQVLMGVRVCVRVCVRAYLRGMKRAMQPTWKSR